MEEDNPLIVLFDKLLKNEEEKKIMELIIKEKTKEEIVDLLITKHKK